MRIRFVKQWLSHAPGKVFTHPVPGAARELVRRGIAVPLDAVDPPKKPATGRKKPKGA